MDNIKTTFTIKDLENLSSIKAHTLRIWERRYNLLQPDRTDTNIRYYDIRNLQKLLNIKYLYDNGVKISKIAEIPELELPVTVRQMITERGVENHALHSFKLAMLNFDQSLFEHTYNQVLVEKTFRGIFMEVFIPFMEEIGLLWQSDTITPAHEHFISNLIKQKLHLNIERLQLRPPDHKEMVFVLCMPLNEIHELGLLYIHYELILRGYRSVYLGQSVPLANLMQVQNVFNKVCFVNYCTVQPSSDNVQKFCDEIIEVLQGTENEMCLMGRKVLEFQDAKIPQGTFLFKSIEEFINKKM